MPPSCRLPRGPAAPGTAWPFLCRSECSREGRRARRLEDRMGSAGGARRAEVMFTNLVEIFVADVLGVVSHARDDLVHGRHPKMVPRAVPLRKVIARSSRRSPQAPETKGPTHIGWLRDFTSGGRSGCMRRTVTRSAGQPSGQPITLSVSTPLRQAPCQFAPVTSVSP